jgi:hypothetical protein
MKVRAPLLLAICFSMWAARTTRQIACISARSLRATKTILCSDLFEQANCNLRPNDSFAVSASMTNE